MLGQTRSKMIRKNSTTEAIKRIFNAQSVAVVGASNEPQKF